MGFLKKIFKPVSKVLDKIVPNEIKPALPYLAAFAPMMLGPGIMGSSMLQRGLMSGGANLFSQLAQEGSEGDANLLSTLMAGGIGALTAPGSKDFVMRTMHPTEGVIESVVPGTTAAQESIASGIAKYGKDSAMGDLLTPLGKASKFLTDPGLVKYGIPAAQGTMDLAYADAVRQQRDWDRDQDSDDGGDGEPDRGRAVRMAMEQAGHDEQTIVEMLASLGYEDPGSLGFKTGGRVGMVSGGGLKAAWNAMKAGASKMKSLFDDADINVSIRDEDVMTDWGPQAQAVGQDVFVTAKSGKSTKVLDDLIEEGYDITKDGNTYSINAIDEGALDIITQKLKIGSKGADEFIESQEYFMPGKTVDTSMMDEESKMIYEALKNKKASGGRVGFAFGGIDSAVEQVDDVEMKENIKFAQNMDIPMETVVEKFIIKFKRKPNNLDELKRFYKTISQSDMNIKETITERMTAKDGGMMSVLPRNKEMDYRAGGMIPMGSKERADDVPARLSKNEFVMTADAVRAAGGGSVNEGARRMYNLMNNLEARA